MKTRTCPGVPRKRIKNLAVRVFFFTFVGRIAINYFSRYYLESLNIFD
jgi:hypothetical protein